MSYLPDVATMRLILKNNTRYKNSLRWCARVDKMSPAQVTAIFIRMVKDNEIER